MDRGGKRSACEGEVKGGVLHARVRLRGAFCMSLNIVFLAHD